MRLMNPEDVELTALVQHFLGEQDINLWARPKWARLYVTWCSRTDSARLKFIISHHKH